MLFDQTLNGLFDTDISFKRIFSQGGGGGGGGGSFLMVKVQNGGYFRGLLKFQIFLGVLEIPD